MRRERALQLSIGAFIVCFIVLSVVYVPNNVHVEYISSCTDVVELDKILPLTCGKITFLLENTKIVASIDGIKVDVAKIVNSKLQPVNNDLYGFYQYCCEQNYEPKKVVDLASFALHVGISLVISTLVSFAIYIVLIKAQKE